MVRAISPHRRTTIHSSSRRMIPSSPTTVTTRIRPAGRTSTVLRPKELTTQSYESEVDMSTRVAQMVPVEILHDDMVGFGAGLPFPQFDLYGKRLFTERVQWGEI